MENRSTIESRAPRRSRIARPERCVPSDARALAHLCVPVALAVLGLALTLDGSRWHLWAIGQLVLGVVFFQAFILLHEAGHASYFRTRALNRALGHVCGFLSMIPLLSWEAIHALHHRWTGWRDRDPTTEGTVDPEFTPAVRGTINLAWRTGFPLFTLGYRFGNYWSHAKLRRHLAPAKVRAIVVNQLVLCAAYVAVLLLWGGWIVAHLGIAYLVGLVISDLFILSQHSHIDIPLANGRTVEPIGYANQVAYTRSLRLPRAIAQLLFFNFNLHELHHARPGVPAYDLGRIREETPRSRPFWRFVVRSRRMSGVDFVFRTTRRTGVEL